MEKKKMFIVILVIIIAFIAIFVVGHNSNDRVTSDKNEPLHSEENKEDKKNVDTQENIENKNTNDKESESSDNHAAVSSGEDFVDTMKDIMSSDSDNTSNDYFPHEIKKYELEIQDIKSYDGIYFEDGKEQDIKNVATIIINNNSEVDVEYAKIVLHGTKTDMEFNISTLPKGGTMVVQEANMREYVEQDYTDTTYQVAPLDKLEMSENIVKVEEEKEQIKITNLTDEEIPLVRVFFKLYMNDVDVYAGGITYQIPVKNLGPNKTIYAAPYHYAPGNSRIMMVRTYDSAQ